MCLQKECTVENAVTDYKQVKCNSDKEHIYIHVIYQLQVTLKGRMMLRNKSLNNNNKQSDFFFFKKMKEVTLAQALSLTLTVDPGENSHCGFIQLEEHLKLNMYTTIY